MKEIIPSKRARENTLSATENCRDAIATLDRALQKEPQDIGTDVDLAEQAIVRLRDTLINRLRQQNASSSTSAQWEELKQVNVALSLIASVEYPGNGIHPEPLKTVRDILQKLLDVGLP